MRRTLILAVLVVSFVFCNAVFAANYFIRPINTTVQIPEIVTKTYSDNIPRTEIRFTIGDHDYYDLPPVESVARSITITDPLGQSKTYLYVKTLPSLRPFVNIADIPKESLIFSSYYWAEYKGNDNSNPKNGIIEIGKGEYEAVHLTNSEYYVLTSPSQLPVIAGDYRLSVECTNGQTITHTINIPSSSTVASIPPVTDITANFDINGRFYVSWNLPNEYLTMYQDATITIRLDRFGKDGNKTHWRLRSQKLPLVLGSSKFEKYTYLKWESDVLRLYSSDMPYIAVQIRILLPNSHAISDWTGFRIDGTVNQTVTSAIIPIPSELTQEEAAVQDNIILHLTNETMMKAYDIQQAAAGLQEIQSLIHSPKGHRETTTTYSGQLGGLINTTIRMLLHNEKEKGKKR